MLGLALQPGQAAAGAPVVRIDGMRFQPEKLVVRQGDRVTWENADLVPHTVTGRGFDSGSIAPSRAWSYRAGKAGTYEYVCTFHPTMKGMLVVEKK